MNAIITWYDSADRLVKDAGEIQQDIASRILACSSREAQMDFVASKVAPAIATRYKAEVVRTKTGGVSFNKADGTRDSTALSALRYWCARTTLFAPSGSAAKKSTTRNKLSAVDRLLEAFEKLSLKEQREFVKSLPRNV